jgi:hypothetical protein
MRALWAAAFLVLAGCLAEPMPRSCVADCEPAGEGPYSATVVVEAGWVQCPEGTTCASGPRGVPGARVFVDGTLVNMTGQVGTLEVRFTAGSHTVCAQHPDHGSASKQSSFPAENRSLVRLLLAKGAPDC